MLLPLLSTCLALALAAPFTSCPGGYKNGQKIKTGQFVKQCTVTDDSYSIGVIGCLTPSGKEIAIGSEAEENELIYSCVRTENGGAQIETDLAKKGCEGGKYQKGETYLSGNKRFKLKCVDDYGSNEILACMTDDGKEVKAGSELTAGSYKYKCVKDSNGSVTYKKEPIGGMYENEKGCGQYAVGDAILSKDKKFRFTCVADGKIEFSHCIVEGGEVKANTKETIGKWSYDCKSTANGGATLARQRVA